VVLMATPPDPAALADRLPAIWPAARSVLASLGVGEEALLASGAATHRLADRFAGWSGDWARPFGETGARIAPGAFHQLWLEARRRGAVPPFDAFAPSVALATADRFAVAPIDDGSLLTRVDYALRLDPARARAVLEQAAARAGVSGLAGTIAGVERGAAGVAALVLDGGWRLTADLFIDASGPGATLLANPDGPTELWPEQPDRLLLADMPAAPGTADHYRAEETGWRATVPLAGRTLALFAHGGELAEGRARRLAGHGAAAEAIRIAPGRRPAPWMGNVVALGDAAVATDAFGWAGFSLALLDLDLLLQLLPGRDIVPGEQAEYNRRAGKRHGAWRDFTALHYRARRRGAFWSREWPVPPELAARLAQFARRGTLLKAEPDLVGREGWIAALIGLGIVPAEADPIARSADPAAFAALARLAQAVAAMPARAPSYAEFLARMGQPAPATAR
jgi:tryptophan halogenase